jgi:protein SCO1/2
MIGDEPLRRSSRRLGLAGLTAAAALLAVGCQPARQKVFNPDGLAGPRIDPPLPKPDFLLRDTEGKPFDFRKQTQGYITLLFLGYTHCPDVCPVHLANIAAALGKLSPEVNNAVKVVFVTTDPARDTPGVVRAWLDKFDRRFIGLVGDSLAIQGVLSQLRLGPITREAVPGDTTYYIGHAAIVMAFTRDNLAHVVYPFGVRQADWAKDLELLAKGG